jgi:hypothetical protein
MNLDHVSIGRDPPEEVNAIIEVPIGGDRRLFFAERRQNNPKIHARLGRAHCLVVAQPGSLPSSNQSQVKSVSVSWEK